MSSFLPVCSSLRQSPCQWFFSFARKKAGLRFLRSTLVLFWVLSFVLGIPELVWATTHHVAWDQQHNLCTPVDSDDHLFETAQVVFAGVVMGGISASVGSLFYIVCSLRQRLPGGVLNSALFRSRKYVFISVCCWMPAAVFVLNWAFFGAENTRLPAWWEGFQIFMLEIQSTMNLCVYVLSEEKPRTLLFSHCVTCALGEDVDHGNSYSGLHAARKAPFVMLPKKSVAFGQDEVRTIPHRDHPAPYTQFVDSDSELELELVSSGARW